MRNVKHARDRPVLVAFRGTPSGTGVLHGARLQCNRDTVGDYDYVKNTIFCPQPAGITGDGSYSTRWQFFVLIT